MTTATLPRDEKMKPFCRYGGPLMISKVRRGLLIWSSMATGAVAVLWSLFSFAPVFGG